MKLSIPNKCAKNEAKSIRQAWGIILIKYLSQFWIFIPIHFDIESGDQVGWFAENGFFF